MTGWTARFSARCAASSSGCIEWTGARKHSGYGKITIQGRTRTAPQASWFLAHGEWPSPGAFVLHSCDNRLCVNIAHLRLGTHQENIQDARDRNRWARGERHGVARLDAERVTEIRRLHDGGLGYKRISKLFGVHEQTVAHVVRRDTWAHVP